MAKYLYGDLETYSEVPINDGTYRYAENSEVMVFAYAVDDGPVRVWDVTADPVMPLDLHAAWVDDEVILVFHNSMFDRTVLSNAPAWKGGCPRLHRWRDTLVQALAHSLPGGLEKLCGVLNIPEELWKQPGKELIQLFCKPRPKNQKLRRATRETHPAEWARFLDYAKFDIVSMRAVHKKLPVWNWGPKEIDLWHLDQRMNDRGFAVDLPLVDGAIKAVAEEQKYLAGRTHEMTDGDVGSATQRDKLLAYLLIEHGVELPDMTSDTVERRMQDPDLPIELRDLLGVRLEASTASVAKYKRVRRSVSADGRLRGTHQFCGAARTGRWAHRAFQPGNLPRPTMKNHVIEEDITALKDGTSSVILPSVMKSASNAIRGVIVAPKRRKLVVADLSNIEGRKGAWLAGEKWKLQAFCDFDAGTGQDLYKRAYGKAFNVDPAFDHKTLEGHLARQIGKVMELMLQYEGGVGAFVTGAAAYGIDLEDLAKRAWSTIPKDVLEEAISFRAWVLEQGGNDYGLPDKVFIVCDALKRLWRQAHPEIVETWADLRRAVTVVVENPGQVIETRRVTIRRDGNWLRIILPSGRSLCYPSPRVAGSSITYMGINPYSRKWQRLATYGGKLLENITQASSRDVFAGSLPAIEAAGYDPLALIHDETVTETPDSSEFSAERLGMLMSTVPDWAPGLPLAAAGFDCYRYRKD